MRIGFVSTRLRGTDGVSLEVEKWSRVLQRMGHDVFYCAGELGGYSSDGTLIPELHFMDPNILNLTQRAFDEQFEEEGVELLEDIHEIADELHAPLRRFIHSNRLELLIVQNALAIPMNLPLGVCLTQLIDELGIVTIAHHHDFYWERDRYLFSAIGDFLDTYFPPKLPGILHITINSIAQKRLKARRGIDSTVIPNVFDFAAPPPGIDEYNRDFRKEIGLSESSTFILQPTRVIRRKGIELAIELVHRMHWPDAHLIISHQAGDEGLGYWNWLQREAQVMEVDLQLIDHLVAEKRALSGGQRIYTLWDVYPQADLVTYLSLYEGFGNALLEAIYFKRLVVVNRYPVYNADIAPLGFEFIELDGFVDDKSVEKVKDLLKNPKRIRKIVDKNYRISQECFSMEILERKLGEVIGNFL